MHARFEQAIQPFYFVAYIFYPKHRGVLLSEDQREAGNQWIMVQNPSLLPLLVAYDTQSAPFPQSFFCEPMLTLSPVLWWKGVLKNTKAGVNHQFVHLAVHLLSAPASSASIERIFSNFGYILSKLRNHLGGATAAKLVFCYRMLHGNSSEDWDIDNNDLQFHSYTRRMKLCCCHRKSSIRLHLRLSGNHNES